MSDTLEINYQGKPLYNIVFEESFSRLSEEIKRIGFEGRKIAVITDSNVKSLYLDEVYENLKGSFDKIFSFVIPAGEENKNLDEIRKVYAYLIDNKMDRKSVLVALGGGVIGDMTGFVAATFLRGVDFIQIPTTLLAQADSSIGGKTGVDFDGYKNMVGAFKMPSLVYTNLSTLSSLPGKQFCSGFAEVMKSALLKDEKFYTWLIDNSYEIRDRDVDVLSEMVYRCDDIKRVIVEKDPFEKKDRALLNLGHTLGHAIEKYYDFKFLHGECVSLGCVAAAFISWKKEFLSKEEFYEIRDMFVPFGLPISVDAIDEVNVCSNIGHDKKNTDKGLKFVLLKKIGKAVIVNDVTEDEMKEAIRSLVVEWD